jgi:tetratricopeptide (TPR) repeat protein
MSRWLLYSFPIFLILASVVLGLAPGVPDIASVLSLLLAVAFALINRDTAPAPFRRFWIRQVGRRAFVLPEASRDGVQVIASQLRKSPQYLPTWQTDYQTARKGKDVTRMQGLFEGGLVAFSSPADLSSVTEHHAQALADPRASWRDLQKAVSLCRLGIWLHDRNAALWSNLGHYLRASQKPQEALRVYRKAQSLRGFEENTYLLKGELETLVLLDESGDAVRVGQKLLRPHLIGHMPPAVQAEVHQLMGRAEWKSGHRAEAEKHLKSSLDMADDYGFVHTAGKTLLYWGRFMSDANERTAACEKFYTALERLLQAGYDRSRLWRNLEEEFRNYECPREIGKRLPSQADLVAANMDVLSDKDSLEDLASSRPLSGCQAVRQGDGLYTIVDLRPIDAKGNRREYPDRAPGSVDGLWATTIREFDTIDADGAPPDSFEPHPRVKGVWLREKGPGKIDIFVAADPPAYFCMVDTRQLGPWNDLVGVWRASRTQDEDDIDGSE